MRGREEINNKIKVNVIYLSYINKNLKDKWKNTFGYCIDFTVPFKTLLSVFCRLFCSLLSIGDMVVKHAIYTTRQIVLQLFLKTKQGCVLYCTQYCEICAQT